MNQKGFANILVIVLLVIVLGVAVGYFTLVRRPATLPADQSQSTNTPPQQLVNNIQSQTPPAANETANWKTYRNTKYGFEVGYPSTFTFHDSQSTPDSWTITKLREGRISKPVDCGGFLKQPDEIGFSWSVFDRQNPEYAGVNVVAAIDKRYNTSKYVSVSIGDKSLKVQRSIPGMCENGDEFIWMEPSGRYIVIFNVNPSNTTLVDEYKAIIASFKFF